MRYTTLGNTGLVVSRLGFGVMTFGQDAGAMGAVWKTGQDQANALVARALDAGVTFFDTADAYAGGQSEMMLAKALGAKRRDVVISTKIGFRVDGDALVHAGLSYRRVIEAVEASLRRLNTDYIDLLSLHTVDPFTPLDETLRALEWCIERGWVRYAGYSNYPAWLAATMVERQRANRWRTMCAAQMYYSLVGRELEHEHVPFAQSAGVGTVVWSPLAGGFLTGRYTREDPAGRGGRLAGFDFIPMDKARAYDVIDRLKQIAAAKNVSVAQLSIAWLLSKPYVDVVLLGASKLEQLDETLGAVDVTLDANDTFELDALAASPEPYPRWYLQRIDADASVVAALSPAERRMTL